MSALHIASRRGRGLTLVELMVALALSLLLAAGAFSIFTATKRASITQQDLARMQENLRFAVTEMIDRISLAGYVGCARSMIRNNANLTSTVPVVEDATAAWRPDLSLPISGTDGAGGAPDTLTVVYAHAEYPIRVEHQTGQTGPLWVWRDKNYERNVEEFDVGQGSILMVSDCERGAVFTLTNSLSGQDGAASVSPTDPTPQTVAFQHAEISGQNVAAGIEHSFGGSSQPPAWIRKAEAARFFIDQVAVDGKQVSVLKVRRLGQTLGQAEELIRGVEDMQVKFGIDDSPFDGSADRYVDWDNTLPSRRIAAVRVTLTVNGGRPVTGGVADVDTDVVRDITFTVKMRNQVGEFR